MFCSNCGTPITPGQNFCSQCGKPLAANPSVQEPPRPAGEPSHLVPNRIEKHTKVLAILWLAVSMFELIPALGIFFGGSIAMHFIPFPMHAFFWPVAGILATLLFAGGIAGILAGLGLLSYRPWARVLAIVLGVIALIRVPFGTALGIYTLWVLLPGESERDYRRLARTTC